MASSETNRLEAFSDGVFAIALTLLILEIHVPRLTGAVGNDGLWAGLAALWPSFFSFLLSFLVVLLMWVNHHGLIRMARGADWLVMMANGFLLLVVTFVPFPTAVLAQYLQTPAANAAAAFYAGTFVLGSIAYNALLWTIIHRRRLVRAEFSEVALRWIRRIYNLALAVYLTATVVSFWSATVGLLLCSALWPMWALLGYEDRQRVG